MRLYPLLTEEAAGLLASIPLQVEKSLLALLPDQLEAHVDVFADELVFFLRLGEGGVKLC